MRAKTIYMILAIFTVALPTSFAISATETVLESGVEHMNIQQPTE